MTDLLQGQQFPDKPEPKDKFREIEAHQNVFQRPDDDA